MQQLRLTAHGLGHQLFDDMSVVDDVETIREAHGGEPGTPGRFLVNGKPVSEARKMTMNPNDDVVLETPGGGGYGPAGRPAA